MQKNLKNLLKFLDSSFRDNTIIGDYVRCVNKGDTLGLETDYERS